MRDATTLADGVFFFLIEGDIRTAGKFTAFDTQFNEDYTRNNHTIDNEENLLRFIGRAMLSSNRARFIQTKDEQGSLRAVAAVGLMASCLRPLDRHFAVPLRPTETEKNKLRYRLSDAGIPYEIATCVADEVGSVAEMELRYNKLDDAELREKLLEHIIEDVSKGEKFSNSSAASWSFACHNAFFSALPQPSSGGRLFDEYKHLVENEALLISHIHKGASIEEALDATLAASNTDEAESERRVEITVSAGLESFMPPSNPSQKSFYQIKAVKCPDGQVRSISLRTCAGSRHSSRVIISLLDGSDLLERLQILLVESDSHEYVRLAQLAAHSLHQECVVEGNDDDTHILLVRGLFSALELVNKQSDFCPQMRPLVDMVMAELMLVHNMVVLQAVRKSSDCETIVQQLALACFHFQALTKK